MRAGYKPYLLSIWMGISHGLNDFLAGYYLAQLQTNTKHSEAFLLYIVYIMIAFGGQGLAGWLVDRTQHVRGIFFVCVSCLSILCFMTDATPWFIIIFSGVVSAFLHVCGGGTALCIKRGSAAFTGIFAAPGVVGLAAGLWLGATGEISLLYLLPVTLLLLLTFPLLQWPVFSNTYTTSHSVKATLSIDRHDAVMIILLLAFTLRSVLWNIVQFAYQENYSLLIWIAVAAGSGKLLGGLFADIIGWKPFIYLSLSLSGLCLALFPQSQWAIGVGMACLQSGIPITLVLLRETMPQHPALASGLGFGVTILVAGLPFVWMDSALWITGWPYLLVIIFLILSFSLIKEKTNNKKYYL